MFVYCSPEAQDSARCPTAPTYEPPTIRNHPQPSATIRDHPTNQTKACTAQDLGWCPYSVPHEQDLVLYPLLPRVSVGSHEALQGFPKGSLMTRGSSPASLPLLQPCHDPGQHLIPAKPRILTRNDPGIKPRCNFGLPQLHNLITSTHNCSHSHSKNIAHWIASSTTPHKNP